MALPPSIRADLLHILSLLRAAHGILAIPTGAGKALEAWILMKLAETASLLPGWTVTLRRGDGTQLPAGASFAFPAKGSGIRRNNVRAPGYVLLEYVDLGHQYRFELRGSLQWQGRSGALHECDISMLPAQIGEAIRNNGGGHPHGLPIVLIECKDKISRGTLDETRETLARLFDLALVTRPPTGIPCRIYETCSATSLHYGRRSSTYVSFFSKGTFGIARATGFQAGTATLSRHYHIGRFNDIYHPTASIANIQISFGNTLRNAGSY